MTFSPSNLIKLTLVSLVLWSTFSCNKDSDILTDYVVENPEALLPNDIVATLPNSPIIIDPLGKDTVEKPENVIITEVTPPTLGTAIVNNDNTITYTPDEDKSGTDKFDYTASVTNPDNSVTTATGNVTVNIEEEEEEDVVEDKTPEVDDPNRVNFSKYGAVGDGNTDDTKAIQAALDAEESLVADEGAVFKITSSLKLTQGFAHDINWNGASIITYVPNLTMIVINKKASNGGTTTMKDLLIDAKNKGTIGVAVYSRAVLTNVDGKNYGQTASANTSPSHIMARYEGNDPDAHGDWIFDGCDAEGLLGYGTECDYLDGIGAANAYLVYWMTVPTSKTTITFKNATIKDSYGPDGQNVGVFSPGIDVSNTLASTIFDNITSSGFERRSWKLFSGNLVIKNCTINNDLASNGVTPCVSAG
ncbi:MAG: Ig-like domain-containing protein, partial [Arenibacter latericius]|nr:Ig-like domain-containing protein [Arenibacter latericius]